MSFRNIERGARFKGKDDLTVVCALAYNSSMEYTIILEPDAETSTVTASVAELPGCVAQGNTEAEALDDVRSAILEYLSVVADETRHLRQVKVAV